MRADPGSLKTMKITKQPFRNERVVQESEIRIGGTTVRGCWSSGCRCSDRWHTIIRRFFRRWFFRCIFATTDLLGLEGREKAAARMYNKIVAHGITGSILACVLPPVIGLYFNVSAKIGAPTSREVGLAVPGGSYWWW